MLLLSQPAERVPRAQQTGSPSSSLLVTGLGCLCMFVAFWLVSSRLVVPIAATVGRPSERIAGAAGRLALRNSQRWTFDLHHRRLLALLREALLRKRAA